MLWPHLVDELHHALSRALPLHDPTCAGLWRLPSFRAMGSLGRTVPGERARPSAEGRLGLCPWVASETKT